jgi:DNA-binding NtrC family response regulator
MLIKPSINILLVENDITILQRCRELLLDEGHKVRTAESVHEALDIVQKHPNDVDIMVISLELPGWGGMTLIKVLQKARSQTLIMTMSVNCGEEAIEAMHEGAYDCIRKSFTTDRFWTKMNRAIEAFRLRHRVDILKRQEKAALTGVEHDAHTL